MGSSIPVGLILVFALMTFSLGTVFAEISKDKTNAIGPMNVTNVTTNVSNNTSLNATNLTASPTNTANPNNKIYQEDKFFDWDRYVRDVLKQ